MRRKIIRQGNKDHGSFTVTLPSTWTKKYSFQAGDEVDIEENGPAVIVRSLNSPKVPKINSINAHNYTLPQLHRHLIEAYRSGAETITIHYQDKMLKHRRTGKNRLISEDTVQTVNEELLGMEIEQKNSEKIIIRQFGEAVEEEFETALKKIFFKLHDQIDLAIAALKTLDKTQLLSMWDTDRSINRYVNFCMRVLNKKGHPDPKKLTNYYAALAQLEFLGDNIYMICQDAATFNMKKIIPEIADFLKHVQISIECYRTYFYQRNDTKVAELLEARQQLFDFECTARFKKIDALNARLLTRIHFCFDQLANLTEQAISIETT